MLGCAVLLVAGAASASPPVRVFAASSLTEALSDASAAFRSGGGDVRLRFDGSAMLARQIGSGAEADLFVPADSEWLDAVRPTSRFDWLGNRLVCIVPRDSDPGRFLLRGVKSLVLAGEQVPAGRYAKAALAAAGIVPSRVVYGGNVRDVVAKVVAGAGEAGIVYSTDAVAEPRVRIAYEFPAASHPAIVYPVGLLRPAGRAFYEFLRGPAASESARARGFEVLTRVPSPSR